MTVLIVMMVDGGDGDDGSDSVDGWGCVWMLLFRIIIATFSRFNFGCFSFLAFPFPPPAAESAATASFLAFALLAT